MDDEERFSEVDILPSSLGVRLEEGGSLREMVV